MLNVTIQNDGKIKIQTECSNTKEMRSNVNLLLAIVSSMEMEEKVNKDAKCDPEQTNYLLYLNKIKDGSKLSVVNTLAKQLNIPSEKAKDIIDKVIADDKHTILLTQSTDLDSINNVRNTLESVGCICKLNLERYGKYDLVLTWVDQGRKLPAVKEVKENLDLWLRDAKGYIDSYCTGRKTILLTGNEDEVTKAAKKFDSSECLRVCVSKH
nr:MAG TPA: hypothetical protein [Bacteriophage sp.]